MLINLIPLCMTSLGTISLIVLYTMQYGFGINPCLMCYPQRWCLIIVTLLYTSITVVNLRFPVLARILSWLTLFFCILGSGIAGRHLWFQWHPSTHAKSCGLSLDYMLEYLPITEVILQTLSPDKDCSKIKWQLFSISMPGWSLILFVCLSLVTIYWMSQTRKGYRQ